MKEKQPRDWHGRWRSGNPAQEHIGIRATEAEKRTVRQRAAARGQTVTDYLLTLVFEDCIPEQYRERSDTVHP